MTLLLMRQTLIAFMSRDYHGAKPVAAVRLRFFSGILQKGARISPRRAESRGKSSLFPTGDGPNRWL